MVVKGGDLLDCCDNDVETSFDLPKDCTQGKTDNKHMKSISHSWSLNVVPHDTQGFHCIATTVGARCSTSVQTTMGEEIQEKTNGKILKMSAVGMCPCSMMQ